MIFEFVAYTYHPKRKEILFHFCYHFKDQPDLNFQEKIVLPKISQTRDQKLVRELLMNLHLVLGLSYYKIFCPEQITIPYQLTKEQADFWNLVYQKGLGEFIYRNKLKVGQIAKFPWSKQAKKTTLRLHPQERSLIGLGGGKDSIVAAELFKQQKLSADLFILETEREDPLTKNIAQIMGFGKLEVKRFLDPKVFIKLPGSYNGHIPISAVIAWVGLLLAVLYDYRYVVVGNEYSSSFGNLKYQGLEINHQWSKSLEFERALQSYVKKFLTPDIIYFSALRQFYELRIVKLFCQYPKYFSLFSSCNRNFKVWETRTKTKWCGECPKCAFMFLMFSAWLPKKIVLGIFGQNLFDRADLLETYQDLLGLGKLKPFDCVGTFSEAQTALLMAAEKFKASLVVKKFIKLVKLSPVFGAQSVDTLPAQFKFLGLENALLLGYGREGQATEKYLEQWPLKIGKADQKLDKKYLTKQKEYEFVIKTPGIKKELITKPYTTATNIFFSKYQNQIIGVTGSKGKSTTASLIYALLKAGGKSVKLLGNIGEPMLAYKPKPKEILVLELSSYQLDDLNYSPQIAVVTNLFPEHMNYHGSIEKYYQAKFNIIKLQNSTDYFIYNSENKLLNSWEKKTSAQKLKFNTKIKYQTKLLGEHNQQNIQAAVAVAKLFKISDKIIKQTITDFTGLPHRLEYVGEYSGIKFYDDAISTTPESTFMAIKTLKNIGTIFLGGEDRGYDFKELEKTIRKYKIKNIVLFPDSGKRILKNIAGLNILRTVSMEQAVNFAKRYTPQGKICLLSTASPSYSVWKNFEEKGDLFQKYIKA